MPLRINLISDLDENCCLETLTNPNQIHAWFLRKAFVEDGIDARLVSESKLLKEILPKTDHTIMVSAVGEYTYLLKEGKYLQKLRSSTAGSLTWYMNADRMMGDGDQYFDYCFTQIEPRPHRPEKYVYAGWGADPSYSYPDQGEKAVFLDSKALRPQMVQKTEKVYQIYDSVLPKLDVKVYNPVPVYNRSRRLPYPDYQAILRKCHYFLCTQFGEGGLSRLEAAACGALLIVPAKLYRERTMRLLNHRLWYTEEDLIEALNKDVDIEANRQRALEHTWDKVAQRILDALNS